MKLVHLVSSLNMGGAERLVYNLSIEQARQGLNVSVISYGSTVDALQPSLLEQGMAVINVGGGFFSRQSCVLQALRQADIIHVHSAPVLRSLSMLLPLLWRKKIIYVVHGETSPKLRGFRLAVKFASYFLSHVVAVSEPAKQAISQRFAIAAKRIGLIPNGVPLQQQRQIQVSVDAPLQLGIVGRLIPLKNVELAIRAVAQVSALPGGFHLHIYGQGTCRKDLETLAQSLNAPVTFHGLVLEQQTIFQEIDLLLIASNTEGLPMVLIEAMTYGIATVSTKVGAIPTTIQHQHNGLLYDVGDQQGLAALLTMLRAEPKRLCEMGEKAYLSAQEKYSIKAVAAAYHALY